MWAKRHHNGNCFTQGGQPGFECGFGLEIILIKRMEFEGNRKNVGGKEQRIYAKESMRTSGHYDVEYGGQN